MYDVRSTTVMPARGGGPGVSAGISRRHVAHDQLAVVLGVAEDRLQRLRALEVEVEIVLPGEADAAVHLDGVAADLPRGVADVGLADGRGHGGVLGARVERPRRVVHGRVRVLRRHQHVRAAVTDGLEGADGLAEDRKSTRLNSSHVRISYAVFCLKKKKKTK